MHYFFSWDENQQYYSLTVNEIWKYYYSFLVISSFILSHCKQRNRKNGATVCLYLLCFSSTWKSNIWYLFHVSFIYSLWHIEMLCLYVSFWLYLFSYFFKFIFLSINYKLKTVISRLYAHISNGFITTYIFFTFKLLYR